MFTCQSFAYVSDGDVSLLVFAPAIERGPLVAWMWSDSNDPKEMVSLQLSDLLDWPFDAFTGDGRSGTLALKTLFPPANSLQEWIPGAGVGWHPFANNRSFLRVTPFVELRMGFNEYTFALYDALDNGVNFVSASALWAVAANYDIDGTELLDVISHAAADYQALVAELH